VQPANSEPKTTTAAVAQPVNDDWGGVAAGWGRPVILPTETTQQGGFDGNVLSQIIIVLLVMLCLLIYKISYIKEKNGEYVHAAPRFRANCASAR
jgi:hypothetical protein